MLQVTILCSDPDHPVNAWLNELSRTESGRAQTKIIRDVKDASGGNFLFLVSCHQIVRKSVRDLYDFALVLHASDLPEGRGWSPHIWQIIEGRSEFLLTLLSAEDAVDTGDIWHRKLIQLEGHELFDEINDKLFIVHLCLMRWALDNCYTTVPARQVGDATYYRRRIPQDSQIDPKKPLLEAFNQLRVADPLRFPAFFEIDGHRYKIRIERMPT